MEEQIDRYEIRREIGRGGMATVYLAYDPRFKRQVAVKVLPRQFTHDPKYLARFEQEAQTIGTLEHPAIVPVHDFGEHNDAPYLVMRYMAGGSLRDRLWGEPLTLEEILPVLQRLAPALDNAHALGIIHRDLKPANILFDEEGRSYLADFGIARLAESSQTVSMVGTPAYMSPEQVEAKRKLDGRSDLYALGVMLYELLSGQKPYEADTPTGQMLMHILEPVPDISLVNPDLSPETQQVINKAMAKDPDERYQSAAELVAALGGLLDQAQAPAAVVAASDEGRHKETAVPLPVEIQAQAEMVKGVGEAGPGLKDDLPASSEPIVGREAVSLPEESPLPARGLPRWLWLAGALLLLVVIAWGIRALWPGADGQESGGPPSGSEAFEPRVRPKDGMTLLYVPAGAFLMGSEEGDENERPVHEVVLNAFWIDSTEVTNDQFARFAAETGYETLAERRGISDILLEGNWVDVPGVNWRHPHGPESDLAGLERHPVVHVAWEDAQAYCEWVGGELPTEAQWEYAARSPESLIYPWGHEFDGGLLNFCDRNCPFEWANQEFNDGHALTSPVEVYPDGASWVGAQDMAGNAWEWVADWYEAGFYERSPLENPSGPDGGDEKALRGGSWSHDAYGVRSSYRRSDSPLFRNSLVGFRCVSPVG
jgi:formylglycine-generating enzyme required for sulfatase activity